MGLDWQGLIRAGAAGSSAAEIKARVDLRWLVEHFGVTLYQSGDKWKGQCPFHEDREPSFEVFPYGDPPEWKVGCWSCDFGKVNDAFDFVSAIHHGIGFTEARDILVALISAAPEVSAQAPAPRPALTPKVDFESFALEAQGRTAEPGTAGFEAVQTFLHSKNLRMDTQWLINEFRIGTTTAENAVVAPHYDGDGAVCGVKVRSADGFRSLLGSDLRTLYGAWRDTNSDTVILCEGETDAWTVAWETREADVDVLALPSGANASMRPEWLHRVQGRNVLLCFDADPAGRQAAARWQATLGAVGYVRLPEGMDAASAPSEVLREALERPETVGATPPSRLQRSALNLLEKPLANGETQMVADFVLDVHEVVAIQEGGTAFGVMLHPGASEEVITSENLSTDAQMRRWSNARGRTWFGSTRDSQELLRTLHLNGTYQRHLKGTRVAGLHGQTMVLPGFTIGSSGWRWVPPLATGDMLRDMILHAHVPWDPAIPSLLVRLHEPSVVTPIVGWAAASALRPRVEAGFPILSVLGGAGYGKTTLMRAVLSAFGSRVTTNLTGTTPHAVMSLLQATNAVPVWVDEYRGSVRQDTKETFDQALRDAWQAGASLKGGLVQDNLQAVTVLPASAPIAVTGEDLFTETSHLERMCVVSMPKEGRRKDVLTGVEHARADDGGMALAFYSWVMSADYPSPPALKSRPDQSVAVAAWGYSLFEQFTQDVCGYSLPVAFDPSRLRREHDQVAAQPSLVTFMRAMVGRNTPGGRAVWRGDSGSLGVNVYALHAVGKMYGEPLPGGPQALQRLLVDYFGEENTTIGRDDSYGEHLVIWPKPGETEA